MRQDFSFNGIIHSCTQHGSQEHFDACEGSAVFGAPVITLSGSDFDEGNSGVIGPFQEPVFQDELPEINDFIFVVENDRPSLLNTGREYNFIRGTGN